MKKIAVIPNMLKDPNLEVTQKVINKLNDLGADVFVCDDKIKQLNMKSVSFVPYGDLFSADLIITLGGDGTILSVAKEAACKGTPIFGINMGRVGFMAEIGKDELDGLEQLFNGNYELEERMMLEAFINGKSIAVALNDICITGETVSRVLEMDLYANGRKVSHYRSDGLILSTSTGSTAYSLSAGGAIVDPKLDCICVTPICSHSLINSRPLIFSSLTEMTVENITERDKATYIWADGGELIEINHNDILTVKKSDLKTCLIRLKNRAFYDILFNKFTEGR